MGVGGFYQFEKLKYKAFQGVHRTSCVVLWIQAIIFEGGSLWRARLRIKVRGQCHLLKNLEVVRMMRCLHLFIGDPDLL